MRRPWTRDRVRAAQGSHASGNSLSAQSCGVPPYYIIVDIISEGLPPPRGFHHEIDRRDADFRHPKPSRDTGRPWDTVPHTLGHRTGSVHEGASHMMSQRPRFLLQTLGYVMSPTVFQFSFLLSLVRTLVHKKPLELAGENPSK